MLYNFLILGLGLVLLVWGAHWLVHGAAKLARAMGISPLVIGLTVVAYGTSSPELVVNISAALAGNTDIAIGNVIGSNIFNVLFILGLCAIILPLKVGKNLIWLDVPIMIAVSGLLYVFCLDYRLSQLEGAMLILGVFIYTLFCFSNSKKEKLAAQDEFNKEFGGNVEQLKKPALIVRDIFFIVGGLVLLVFGSKYLVDASVAIARYMGVSELVIALTIIAAGTSLPEVATSVVATIKGERDIAIGNVVGSNIYNILAILGVTALISKGGLPINPASINLDIPFMFFVAIICYPVFRSHSSILRWEGLLFLSLYVGYTVYLVQSSH